MLETFLSSSISTPDINETIPIILDDSGSYPPPPIGSPIKVTGSLQEFDATLLRIVPPNGDFIYLQRMPPGALKQESTGDFIFLQRFAPCRDEPKDVIIWLMRAKLLNNTKYLYWRSPRKPGYGGNEAIVDVNTLETLGSIYGVP